MGWLGHQYIWHQVFAAQHELAYMPHPLRDFFAYDFLGACAFRFHLCRIIREGVHLTVYQNSKAG